METLSALKPPPQLPALWPLFAAIAGRDTAAAEIVWWGDSVSEGSTLTNPSWAAPYRFQEMLRGAFPTYNSDGSTVRGGRGYVPVFWEASELTDEWVTDISMGGGAEVAFGADTGLGAKKIDIRNGATLSHTGEFTDFDLHYTKGLFLNTFTVSVDGVQQGGSINANAGSTTGGFIQSYTGFAPGTHTIRVTSDNSNFWASINGAELFYDDKNRGIHVLNAAKNGASASAPTYSDEHYRTLTTMQPDCVVVQLITNDSIFLSTPAQYKTALISNFTKITTAMASKKFTLIGMTVSKHANALVSGTWADYLKAMKEALAGFSNSMFIDMSDFMGPTVAGDQLGLWSDAVHLNRKGHNYWSDRLLHALNLNGGGAAAPVGTSYFPLPFSKTGNVAVGTGKFAIYNDTPKAWTFDAARAEVGTAPTGAGINLAVKVDGATRFNIPIASGATTSGLVTPVTTAVPVGSKVTIDVTQVGSTVAGADLSVTLTVSQTV